jgi:hypothetical protein
MHHPLREIGERELCSASTTRKDGVPFLAPVGFAPQKNQLLPASTLKHDALGARDKVFRRYLRNLLHAAPPVPPASTNTLTMTVIGRRVHEPYVSFLTLCAYLLKAAVPLFTELPRRVLLGNSASDDEPSRQSSE